MAEVRLRLLGRSAELLVGEDVMASGRARGPLLAASCMPPAVCTKDHIKCPLWPSTPPRGPCMWVPGDQPQSAMTGARFYSQRHGPRSSFHDARSRRTKHNNGAAEPETPLYTTRTGYYDILEVTGNATHSQIKTAYYKQSFRFHPDRNNGDEAATRRFGQVTEAYHVLGSTSLRKKYDRGILCLEDVRNARKPSGKSSSPSRKDTGGQRQASGSSNTSTLAKPLFDFDAFYQAHYGEQLAREKLWKERREDMEKKKQQQRMATKLNRMAELSTVALFLPVIFLYLALKG